ncbi:MAG: isochorismatase family protein [Bradymonadales bacterium]|nr:isochorismatase family protein [Bradymonadales bacterium]
MEKKEKSGPIVLQQGDALVVVDVQHDFLPGGALAVPHGDEVIEPLNRYIARFEERGLPIFATRDWHPARHCSFAEQGGPWPPHCVKDSWGAEFSAWLQLPSSVTIISKADREEQDAYSGFEGTDLHRRLGELGVKRLFVGGLATDYCVLNGVQDALRLGYTTFLLVDAVRAVDVNPGDGVRALAAMEEAGAVLIRLEMLA